MPENRQEAIQQIIDGISYLILAHANSTASEQWSPSHTADESDDYIKEHSEWVVKLRIMRDEFENLVTGFIPKEPKPQRLIDNKWTRACPSCGEKLENGQTCPHLQNHLLEQEKTLEAIENRARQMIMGKKDLNEKKSCARCGKLLTLDEAMGHDCESVQNLRDTL